MSSDNSNDPTQQGAQPDPQPPVAAPSSESVPPPPAPPAPPAPPVHAAPSAPPVAQTSAPQVQSPYQAGPQGAYSAAPAEQADSAAPAAPGGPAGPGQPPAKKGGFPAWAWWVIGGGLALVAVIVVVVVLFFANVGGGGPQNVAEEYVSSLDEGNTDRANELARVNSEDKRLVVLTSGAFAEAEGATDFKIESFRHHDNLAMAEVSYLVDGSKLSDYIEVSRDGDGWYVSSGLTYRLPTISASGGVEGYRIPGFDGVIGSDLDLQAYPGTYTMQSPSELFELVSDTTFEVGSSTSYAPVDPEFEPTQLYFDQVNDAMKTNIDACLDGLGDSDVYSLSSCGVSAYPEETYSVDSFTVKVDEYPSAGVDSRYGGVTIAEKGAVTVTIKGSQIGGDKGTEKVSGDFGGLYFTTSVSGDTVDVEFY